MISVCEYKRKWLPGRNALIRTKKAGPQMKAGFDKADKKILLGITRVLRFQVRVVSHFLDAQREQQVFFLQSCAATHV